MKIGRILRRLWNPRRDFISVRNPDIQKGGYTMIPIHHFEVSIPEQDDDRFWDLTVRPDEVCTCPKPLLGASHICFSCRRSFFASLNNSRNYAEREWAKWCLGQVEFYPLPLCLRPKSQGKPSENVIPFGVFGFIGKLSKRPSISRHERFNPHLKDLIRHIWEKLTRRHSPKSNPVLPTESSMLSPFQ
jgi:hypothetical protein